MCCKKVFFLFTKIIHLFVSIITNIVVDLQTYLIILIALSYSLYSPFEGCTCLCNLVVCTCEKEKLLV